MQLAVFVRQKEKQSQGIFMDIDFVLITIVLERMYWVLIYGATAVAIISYGFFIGQKISSQIYRWVILGASITWVTFLVTRALYYAWVQYSIWISNPVGNHLTQLGLEPAIARSVLGGWVPVFSGSGGYFLYYATMRFFLGVLLTIGASVVWYIFLKALKKYRSRLFEEGEVELGFLCALLVGWPLIVVFIPITLLIFVLIAVARRIILKKEFTTIATPLFLALVIVIWAGEIIMKVSALRVLAI